MEKTEFKKYFSIENSYRQKTVDRAIIYNPEYNLCKYILEEKLHGANMSVIIDPTGVQFGRRKALLEPDESFYFYDYQNSLKSKYTHVWELFENHRIKKGYDSIRLYGEYCGGSIQHGVWYGKEKQFRLFDIFINDKLIHAKAKHFLLSELNLSFIRIPVIAIVDTLQEALDFDIHLQSALTPEDYKEDNIIEGVVIKPYDMVVEDRDSPFYLKKKNEKFSEKKQKGKKSTVVIDEKYEKAHQEFLRYLTDARVQSVISKEGKLEDMSQIGNYIKLVTDDMKEDFFKEGGLELVKEVNDKHKRAVFNVSKQIVPMLRKYFK